MRLISALAGLVAALVAGCSSQTSSYHYAQKQIERGDLGFHRTLRVDEYLNAFPQDWFKVAADQEISLRIDTLTSRAVQPGETALYQVAVKTRMPSKQELRSPLALSFVIDVSGSMNSDQKIVHTREALRNSLLELKDGDVVSLVIFNNEAQVVASNVIMSNTTRAGLVSQVEALHANGGTNIENGLVAGYKEMAKFPAAITKRLILLTDGQSNVGTVTPDQIAKEAAVQRIEGARISTIGLGYGVNEALLRQIAEAGQGHYYFAENAQTLTKILREGLQTTVVPVAKDVTLEIELGEQLVFERIHGGGTETLAGKHSARIALGELNVNDWRILVVELKRVSSAGSIDRIHVAGRYTSPGEGSAAGTTRPISQMNPDVVDPVTEQRLNPFVLRNAVLYGNAQALIEASRLSELKRYEDALRILDVQINNQEVLAALDKSEMVRKERDNLIKVRAVIGLMLERGTNREAKVTPPARAPDTSGNQDDIRSLVAAGLKSTAVALPGLWTTIAILLAAVIE
jgi:Ca-activated chloride channel homolog